MSPPRLLNYMLSLRDRSPLPQEKILERFNDARDNEDWLAGILDTPLDQTLASQRLATMPSLLDTTFPPCGLNASIAYENVLHRLRLLWLHTPAPTSLLSLCETVELALAHDNIMSSLKPYRRLAVFINELRWIKYFIREAGVAQEWDKMSIQEKHKQEFMERMYTVPKELGILFKKKQNREGVLGKWEVWNAVKRGGRSAIQEEWEVDEVDEWEYQDEGKGGDGGEGKEEGCAKDLEDGVKGLGV